MNVYVALLRGINVGGKNLIKMADLASCFETLGLKEIRTYIQSGNVIFSAGETDQARLTGLLEDALSSTFNYASNVVLRSVEEMKAIVMQAPAGFGSEPTEYRYDVIFLKKPLSTAEVIQDIPVKTGIDQAFAENGVLYFSRLISKASQSHLSRIISMPAYRYMTVRNWNTTTKLLALMQATNP